MKDPRVIIAQIVRCQLQAAHDVELGERATEFGYFVSSMQRLEAEGRKLHLARRHGLRGAQRRLLRQLRMHLSDLGYHLESVSHRLSRPLHQLPAPSEIIQELDQLETEFGGFGFNPSRSVVKVKTEPIELEGLYLGPFGIQLHLPGLCDAPRHLPLAVVALDPHPPAQCENVTHPHVRDDELCTGDALLALRAALLGGRLCDFFVIVRQVLGTYNPGSPFVAVEDWHGRPCADCGDLTVDERCCYCDRCEQEFCEDCISYCGECSRARCRSCLGVCQHCEDSRCEECMRRCKTCGQPCCASCLEEELCPTCIEQQEENDDERKATQAAPSAA